VGKKYLSYIVYVELKPIRKVEVGYRRDFVNFASSGISVYDLALVADGLDAYAVRVILVSI
jgi:hypothetical protein